MRDRHNIVGSEVGRPRPPVYLGRTARLQKKRARFSWIWILLAVAVLTPIVLVAI